MLQVSKAHQRRGIGKYILSVVEAMAKERGISTVGIHTTEDNTAARGLYTWAGYTVTEIGPCTTADGVDRVGYTFQKQI
jgi:ribosomal protein S18 acetylase RimI-like enzyme